MGANFKVLGAGAIFFLASQSLIAQVKKSDSTKTKDIEEVVLVGYTRVKKDDYVGTASKVDNKSIETKAVSNISQALAGESAGVRVINTSGQPGSEATIRIRGFGSVNGNRSPLYVLDGVPYTGNISAINPDDIESTVILKDATATSVYGARGANGVVLLTTKKGRANRSSIQLESKIGYNFDLLPRYETIKSPETYIGLAWEALFNNAKQRGHDDRNAAAWASNNLWGDNGINPKYNLWGVPGSSLIDPTTRTVRAGIKRKYDPERWEDYAFQTSVRSEHNLSISGGSDKTTYYTGIGYLKDEGYSLNTSYERYSGRLNLTHKAKPWLTGEFNLGYTFVKSRANGQESTSSNIFWVTDGMPAIYPLFERDENGNKIIDPYFGGYKYDYGIGRGYSSLTNAVGFATYDRMNRTRHEVNSNFFLKADILKGLSFETRIGGQFYSHNTDDYSNPYYGSEAPSGGLYKGRNESFSYNWNQLLRYQNRFGNHGVQAFVAHESNSDEDRILRAEKKGLIIPSGTEFSNAITISSLNSYINNFTLESYFGQVAYDFANKYFLTASARRDGSSRFLNDKWDNFWSAGAAWIVSKESFLRGNSFFRNVKLKASYGTVGDQGGVGYYPGYSVYDPANFMDLPAASFNRIGYPNLTWEKSKIFQAGAELTLFSNRALEISVDYYNKTTDQLIFDNRLAPSTGNAVVKVNEGRLVNKGFEFNVVGHIINKKDYFLDLSINGEIITNKLKSLPIDPSTGLEKVIDLSESGYGRAVGHSIYDYYMREYRGVNSANGRAQWTMHYEDKNGNNSYDSGEEINSLYEYQRANPNAKISETLTEVYSNATQKFVGKSVIPDVRGAFSLRAGYKGFSISTQMLYSLGGYAYDSVYAGYMENSKIGTTNWHKDMLNRWQKEGDVTDIPKLSHQAEGETDFADQSTRFLTKTDYLVLNNVSLSYELPKDLVRDLGLTGLSFNVTGDNLWIATARKGFNPTTSETGGSSSYRYNPLSNFTFGVKVNF